MFKKSFIIQGAAVAMLLSLLACSKENGGTQKETSDASVSVCLTADIPSDRTKATDDQDGAGVSADRCRLQVFMKKSGNATKVYDGTRTVSSLQASFNDIVLLKNQTYFFLFWADNASGDFYNTDDLRAVTFKGDYLGNDDRRDAFFGSISDITLTEPLTKSVTLVRPFAQVNIITTDIPAVSSQLPQGVALDSVVPNKTGLTLTAPDTFNVYTGVASGSKAFNWKSPVYAQPYKTTTGSKNTLVMDYIFASSEMTVNQLSFTAVNDQPSSSLGEISAAYSNIPLQRNFRTNIVGALLTNTASVTVEINPFWYGEYGIDQ